MDLEQNREKEEAGALWRAFTQDDEISPPRRSRIYLAVKSRNVMSTVMVYEKKVTPGLDSQG
ncbi:hypothetical protein CJP46_04845 [Paenibacillus sp. XY044]|nr:hypothetical protein CJP46_04845 [Paenibacillus sp. XY044]